MRSAAALKKAMLCLMLGGMLVLPVSAQHTFDGNLFFDNMPQDGKIDGGLVWDADSLIKHFPLNDNADPQLGDPFNMSDPNWIPAITSPAVGWNDDVSLFNPMPTDSCYYAGDCFEMISPVCWRGCFAPAEWEDDWSEGWTYHLVDGAGRTDIDYTKPQAILEVGEIAYDRHLVADSLYILTGGLFVGAGHTMTIDAGVVVLGVEEAYIAFRPGAQIQANGTAENPIIMTSAQDPGNMARGDWAGLAFLGAAEANCGLCGETGIPDSTRFCTAEGFPPGQAYFCGDDDCDDSGYMRYVRVEYAGYELAQTNELNAFTFNGLGAETDFAYLQAHMGSDDQFEWFGGKCQMHHLVATGGADDNFDWQMGFRGSIQFGVSQTWPDAGDRGIEADNNEFDYDAECRSNPVVSNLTLIGPGNDVPSTASHGIRLRRGTDAQIYNCVIMGWPDHGIRVSDPPTVARGFHPVPGIYCGPAAVDMADLTDGGFGARAYPNLVSNDTRFAFYLPENSPTKISVFDATGRMVEKVLDREMTAGEHSVNWSMPGLSSGTYFYRVQTNQGVATGRIFKIAG